MDGDDNQDVLSASVLDNKIAWYKNLGNGFFSTPIIISTQVLQPRSIIAEDIDGDGDNDVVSVSSFGHEVAWFTNDSFGNFGPKQVISNSYNYLSVFSCDLDGDGTKDIVASPEIFINNGNGLFTNSIVFDNLIGYLTCNDLDNDGDIDIALAYGFGNLAWYANDSLGNFGARNQIASCINGPNKFAYADIDNDNLKDIVVGSGDELISVCWFKNFGNGNYAVADTINFGFSQTYDLQVVDLDEDSLKDVLSLYYANSTNYIGWNKQDTSGQFSPIQIVSDSAVGGFDIHVSDLDGDGDYDILFGSTASNYPNFDSKLFLWKNDGSGNFGNKIIIKQGSGSIYDIKTFDLNNDGNMDILFTENKVKWGKNLGGANNFQYIPIGNSWYSQAVNAADLDGDNNLDVVYSTGSQNPLGSHIAWAKNNGNGSFSNSTQLFPAWSTKNIELKDMDKDGDIDIIAEQYTQPFTLFWLENDGLGNFVYASSGYSPCIADSIDVTCIIADDLDGDGDNDVLYNSKVDGLVAWAENLGYITNDADSACANLPYTFGGQVLTMSGIYHDTLQTIFGLDSVIELTYSQIPIPSVSIAPFPQDTFCIQTGAIDFPLVNPPGGSFSGPGVTATNINLNLADTGTHEISYIFTDTTSGCSNSDTTQFVVIDCLTIPEAKELGISVYPNPADHFITVVGTNLPAEGNVQIRIFDVSAKLVREESPGSFPYKMDIGNLKTGVYYLQLYTGEKTVVFKLVKR